MIRFLEHSEIDKDSWNKTAREAMHPTIFVDFDFLSLGAPDWCALVEDDYQSIMPLPVRSKLSIKYVFTPFFYSRMGIFSKKNIGPDTVKAFVDAIPRKYRQIDLFLNENNPGELIEHKTFELISHQMKLGYPYEFIARQYSQNTSRNIKAAQKQELQYTEEASIKEIIRLFQQNRGKQKAVHYKKRDYYTLMKLSHHAHNQGILDSIGALCGGKLIAGALFLRDYDRIWFWFSGRDSAQADKKAMFFLLDEYIQRHAGQLVTLDFNGSMNENVARLYKGFGGIPYTFNMLHYTRDFYLGGLIKLYKAIKH
ncbi:MAG: GNAT family N-acetyltransferase [Bacteroidales bacterium]|nr:GNAT family N-acetyltransferase [Bacteroidales bacterium]